MTRRTRDVIAILALALIWGALVFIVGVGGDFPLNDDWVHAWSVKYLADGGGLALLPYAGPLLYFQVILGALVVKLFGFSFVTLRVLTLVLAFIALVSFYKLLRLRAVRAKYALPITLVLGLNPWFVNLSFTFMTDVPALAFLLLASVCFVAGYLRRSPWLMALANLAALGSMFIRQSGVLFFPAALLALLFGLRRKGVPRLFFITIAGTLVALGAYGWLWRAGLLPESATVHLTTDLKTLLPRAGEWFLYGLLYLGLFTLPLFAGMAWKRRKMFLGGKALVWLVIVAGVVAGLWIKQGKFFPYVGNIITHEGLGVTGQALQGTETAMFPLWIWWMLTGAATLGTAWLLRFHVRAKLHMLRTRSFPIPVVFVGTLAAFQFVLVLVVSSFDRYFLPALAFFLAYVAMYYGKRMRMSRAIVITAVVIMGAYSIIGTQNYLRWNAVRWRESVIFYDRLGTQKIVESYWIEAGYEWCGWAVYLGQGGIPRENLKIEPNPHDRSKPWYVNSICPTNTAEYVISFSELPGYNVIKKATYQSWYDTSPWLYVLKKKAN